MLALIKRPAYIKDVNASYSNSYIPRPIPLYEKLYFSIIFWPIVSPILGYFNKKRVVNSSNIDLICDVEVDGIDHSDYPDYVDAFITSATWLDSLTPLTDAQLEQLNEDQDFVYNAVQKHLY